MSHSLNAGWKKGDHWVVCDVCGKDYRNSVMTMRWDNKVVCPADFEERHPSDLFRGTPDDEIAKGFIRPQSAYNDGISYPGDANVTLTVDTSDHIQIFDVDLTANRTITLNTSNARDGSVFKIFRKDAGAFTLDVGGLKTIPASTQADVVVGYTGTAWQLLSYEVR